MMTKNSSKLHVQADLFKPLLIDIVSKDHPLIRLADSMSWSDFDDTFKNKFCDNNGRPSLPNRLMVGLHYLKYSFNLSDEGTVCGWLENPYWQYFTGGEYFEHKLPLDSSSMTRWRKRLGEDGAEELLSNLIKTALQNGFIKKQEIAKVNVDTTVQEKDIRFPTDARLYDRMLELLVKASQQRGIKLRQTYKRVSKQAIRRQSGYSRARQMKRARKQTSKLRTYLGRVIRDVFRKAEFIDDQLANILETATKLYEQKKGDKNKIYSVHEQHVECIAKGKVHKKYEFGCKASYVTTATSNWVVGAMALHGNPYDGHTLEKVLNQVESLTNNQVRQATCDMGYRGHKYKGDCDILIVNRYRKRVSNSVKKWWKRRSAIEPVIGHLKTENRLDRNRLKGKIGDKINAIMAACGFNMRKLLKAFALFGLCIKKLLFFIQKAYFYKKSKDNLLYFFAIA